MEREKQIYRITLLGSAGNVLLVIVKFIAGILGRSSAMIADAVHSLSDFLTDIIVLVFVGISARPQDSSHDYGHGKFETMATLFIGLALVGASIGIIVSGALKLASWLQGADLGAPRALALWVALLSILIKEIMFRITEKKGRELSSPALKANAWHHRSDALSSVGTALGIGGAIFFGEKWAVLDPLASIVVGLFIVRVSVNLLRGGIGDLTEQSLPDAVEQEILQLAGSVEGVEEPHDLRTRKIGNHYAIELHILMDGNVPLLVAHDKATAIEDLLRKQYGEETHVVVHVEPISQPT